MDLRYIFMMRSAKKTGKKRNQGDTDEGNTAASHKLLNALRLSTGIILTISFQKVDAAPYAERTAEGYDKSLQGFDCRVKEFHTDFRGADLQNDRKMSFFMQSNRAKKLIHRNDSGKETVILDFPFIYI